MYIGLTSVYPLKVMNARSRTVEQKKMKIDSGPESSQWWGKLQNFISRDFQDDVMYFQVDYNGILQTFHCRPTKHPNDAPLRMTFTGDAYDLNFTPPKKINFHRRSTKAKKDDNVTIFTASSFHSNRPGNASDHEHIRRRRSRSEERGQVVAGRPKPKVANEA